MQAEIAPPIMGSQGQSNGHGFASGREAFSMTKDLIATGGDISAVAQTAAKNTLTLKQEFDWGDAIISYQYKIDGGRWTNNGRTLEEISSDDEVGADRIQRVLKAETMMMSNKDIKQAVVASEDLGYGRHYFYIFTKKDEDPSVIQALAIEFQGTKNEFQKAFDTLSFNSTAENSFALSGFSKPLFFEKENTVTRNDVFHAAYDSFDTNNRREEMNSYLKRLTRDTEHFDELIQKREKQENLLKQEIENIILSNSEVKTGIAMAASGLLHIAEQKFQNESRKRNDDTVAFTGLVDRRISPQAFDINLKEQNSQKNSEQNLQDLAGYQRIKKKKKNIIPEIEEEYIPPTKQEVEDLSVFEEFAKKSEKIQSFDNQAEKPQSNIPSQFSNQGQEEQQELDRLSQILAAYERKKKNKKDVIREIEEEYTPPPKQETEDLAVFEPETEISSLQKYNIPVKQAVESIIVGLAILQETSDYSETPEIQTKVDEDENIKILRETFFAPAIIYLAQIEDQTLASEEGSIDLSVFVNLVETSPLIQESEEEYKSENNRENENISTKNKISITPEFIEEKTEDFILSVETLISALSMMHEVSEDEKEKKDFKKVKETILVPTIIYFVEDISSHSEPVPEKPEKKTPQEAVSAIITGLILLEEGFQAKDNKDKDLAVPIIETFIVPAFIVLLEEVVEEEINNPDSNEKEIVPEILTQKEHNIIKIFDIGNEENEKLLVFVENGEEIILEIVHKEKLTKDGQEREKAQINLADLISYLIKDEIIVDVENKTFTNEVFEEPESDNELLVMDFVKELIEVIQDESIDHKAEILIRNIENLPEEEIKPKKESTEITKQKKSYQEKAIKEVLELGRIILSNKGNDLKRKKIFEVLVSSLRSDDIKSEAKVSIAAILYQEIQAISKDKKIFMKDNLKEAIIKLSIYENVFQKQFNALKSRIAVSKEKEFAKNILNYLIQQAKSNNLPLENIKIPFRMIKDKNFIPVLIALLLHLLNYSQEEKQNILRIFDIRGISGKSIEIKPNLPSGILFVQNKPVKRKKRKFGIIYQFNTVLLSSDVIM